MQGQRLGRFGLAFTLLLAAFVVLDQPARSQIGVSKKRQEKAERFADRLLEQADDKKMIRSFRNVGREPTEVRDLYYATVLRAAEDYLTASPDGPRVGQARRLLCGHEACTPAADFIDGSLVMKSGGGEEPRVVGGEVRGPKRLSRAAPQYTRIARLARIQGTLILKAIIDEKGDVKVYKVVKGLPLGMTESAVEALEATKFSPAMLNGEPVRVYYYSTHNFRLN